MQGLPWRSTDASCTSETAARPTSLFHGTPPVEVNETRLPIVERAARVGDRQTSGSQRRGADECPGRGSPPGLEQIETRSGNPAFALQRRHPSGRIVRLELVDDRPDPPHSSRHREEIVNLRGKNGPPQSHLTSLDLDVNGPRM